MNVLDDQNRLRLMTVIRTLDQMIDLLPPDKLEIAQALRRHVQVPAWNLQCEVNVPLDDRVEIRL